MKRVLIPTNDPFGRGFAEGYASVGCEPVVGMANLEYRKGTYDIIHLLWPEELVGYSRFSEKRLRQIEEMLDWWANRSKLVCSVQNLYPHGRQEDSAFKDLYNAIYRRCLGIHHFSHVSQERVAQVYPLTQDKSSRVTVGFNYPWLRHNCMNRSDARRRFCFQDDDIVLVVLGSLRQWSEVRLLQRALGGISSCAVKPVILARCNMGGPMLPRYIQKFRWMLWKRRISPNTPSAYIDDDELSCYLEAADIVLCPRIDGLSSGLIGVGMTFGKIVIAPNCNSFPEYLRDAYAELYDPGNAASLAEAIRKASKMDREHAREHNMAIAQTWSWDRVARAGLELAGVNNI